MGQRPLTGKPVPSMISPLWFSFDPAEDDKALWLLEQEVAQRQQQIEQKHCDTVPIGKSGNESFEDEEEEEEDEEDDDDNDDEESESQDDDDDDDAEMDVEDQPDLPATT